MSERDELLASEMIAARLRDPNFQDTAAVARTRNTGFSDELIQDMANMNDVEIRAKYGDPAYRAAMRMGEGSARIDRIDRGERSTGEIISDSATGAAGAAYRTFGNLAGIGAGYMVDWMTDGAIPREQATADILSEHNRNVEGFLQNNLTTQLQDRTRLFQIEGELDKMDNQAVYEREVQEGADPFMAGLRREGRNAVESAERAWNSPDVTGQIISEGIGDLALSVPLAGAGGLIAKGATTALVRNTVAQRAAQAAGISAGAATTEVAGVYAETVNDVMSIPLERLGVTSSLYNELLSEGFTPENARLQLAGMAAETAAIRQIAPSLALGFITSRFEAMPIGSFRGVGVTKGLLSIAGEGIEEAGQGASGTINRNMSVEEYAQIGRGALEGVGEEAALGAIAGMGVAGVMATPASVRGSAQTAVEAANALFSETTYNDSLRQDIMGGSVASRAAQTVADVTRPVREAAATAVSAGATQAANLAGRVGQEIVEYTNRPTDKEVVESVQATVNASESLRDVAAKGQLRDNIQIAFDTPDVEVPSEGLADVAGGSRNVFDNVTGIVAKMGSKGFKATDADIAYAAAQFQKLQGMITSLPKEAQKEFGKVLSSKMVQNVVTKATTLDLNKEGAPTDIQTVRNVAKVNPTAVNPDATDLILEQSGEQISPEDTKLMKAASKLARIVNRNVEAKVQISRTENVNLTASGRPAGKEKTITDVSRQIYADGMVSEGGKKLRSINDFVREIFTGIQSPEGTVINQQGRVQSVTDVMKDMQNFAQHMVNKVQALNESLADGYTSPDGKRGGRLKNFDSPIRGVRREGVRYSPSNPNSVAFAQQVAEDQNAVVDAFNTLREEFPEVFGSFPKMEKVVLAKPDTQPTGIEEEVSPETSDEQNQQTNQETQTPTADDEVSSETEEQNQTTEEDLNISTDTGFITDEQDNVMVFYHGTGGVEFDQFADSRDGIFLTTRKGQGREYAIGKSNPRLMSVNVRATNPLLVETDDPQNQWLTKRGQLEMDYKAGNHDAIILSDGTDAIVIVFNGDQIAIVNQNIDARPTVVEEVSAPAETDETKTNESMVYWNGIGLFLSIFDTIKEGGFIVREVSPNAGMFEFGYVTASGKRIAGTFEYNEYENFIDNFVVTSEKGPNNVGMKQMRFLAGKILKEFPNAVGVAGFRQSGARASDQSEGVEIIFDLVDGRLILRNTKSDTSPTAVEEESNSERGTDEERAQATSETETNEEIVSDEPIPSGTKWDDIVAQMTEAEKARMRETVRERLGNARSFIKATMPTMNKYVKQIRIVPIRVAGLGHAFFADQTIHIREDGFNPDGTLNALGKAILVHETGHLVDNHANPVGRPYSSARMFYKSGKIYNEMNALRGKMSGFFNNRLEYAFTRNTPEKIASELFAVATEMAFSTEEFSGDLGNTAAFMEEVYGDLIRTETTGTTTEVSSEETQSSDGERNSGGSQGADTASVSGSSRKVTALFNKSFVPRNGDPVITSLDDLMQKFGSEFKMNREYLTIMNEILPDFVQRMNARLKMRVKDGQITKTIAQHIKDGRVEFRKFKAGALMNPETEQYDPDMLNLAVLAVMDFISTAAASDPRKLDDTLEKMGLNKLDLTEEGMNKILFGIPPSQLSDTIADDLKRLWHIKENEEASVDDLEGVTHGFAKEILTVLAEMDIIDIDTVKLTSEANQQDAATILVNTEKMSDYQKRIAGAKGEGISNTVRETIFNESRESYSIGSKIPTVSVRKGRGTGIMSALERMAVRRMQDIPHRLQMGRARLLEAIGEDNLATMLGYRDPASVTHPVLKRSVLGKNASVRRDLIEVTDLINGMMEQQASEVFFPVGVTKVGRHQMQGPNPQNNKLMRYVVAPQRSVLSTTDADDIQALWLGVLQQADMYKAEKKDREDDFRAAQEAFADKYGPAVQMVKNLMTTGEFDSDAFLTEVGQVEPAVLAAIEAIAGFELAVANGEATFETALSFELDGLTNGAANMMINFGHGLMTPEDWGNFKRVGYFLGTTAMTVNKFFKNKEKDLYEMVSQLGDQMMTGDLKFLKPWQQEQRKAAGRLASAFGNFEMLPNGDFKMTRNTAKNPMTKVNYGSGVQGVAIGVADDMLLEFYEKLQTIPENADWDTYYYPGVVKDMETLGLKLPNSFDKNFVFSNDQVEAFRKAIQFTVGKVLTNATRQVLGHRIEQLNDMLVLSTNIQSEYLQKLFDREINALAEKLAREGVIKRNKKGEPNKGEIPRKYFKELEDRLSQMGAIFVSDEQTLAVGGFDKKLTDLRLSSNFDEKLVTPARMRRPDDVGVRALPFAVIGTGDAMMMNLIFGADNAPNDVLPVFDGIDVPVSKIKQYAPQINEAVLKSWDRDVLGMAVQNFEGFMSNNLEADILNDVWAELMTDNKKESLQFFQGPEDLQAEMTKRLKENRARKKVFRQMAVSVDQMGGSDVGFTRDGESWTLSEVNHRIEKEINNDTKPKDVKKPVEFTIAKALLDNMRNLTPDQKKAVEILKPLMGDVRVIFGTLDQLNEYRQQNFPDDGAVLKAPSNYDFKNNVMFMSIDTNEAVLHEMVHAATYGAVLQHYQGVKNDAVARLEILMGEFMDIQSDGKAMNEAQAAIARRMARNDPINQAAAVNEFMAYVLTNSRVRSTAKQVSVIADFGSKVIALLRRMLGGMPTSLYDHVVFNTRVLNEPNVDDGGNGNTPPPDEPGDETSDPFENHSDYWIENLKAYMRSFVTDTSAKQKTGRDIYNAEKVINDLRQGGLLANSKDRSTFKAIYGIMLSNMKLDATARIALTRVFQHIVENMTPEMFGSNPEDRQTYSAVLNSFGSIENEGTSDAAAVLFALSQTSKKFRAVLEQIPAPEAQAAVEGSLVDFMTRAASFSMKKLMGSLNENNAPQEVLDAVAQVIIDHDKEKEFRLLKRVTESLTAADNMVSGALSSTSDWMLRKDQEIQAQSRGKVIPFLMSSVTLATNLLDKKNTDLTAQGAKKITHMGLPILSIVPIREMVSEIVGTDKQNSVVVDLLNKVNAAVSGMRQAYREDLPGILEREFVIPPTKEQWKAMFNTLAKTDFSVLVDLDNMRQTMKFLEESATRRNEIQRLEQDLAQSLSGSAMADVIAKSKQLADFMNGQAVGKLLVRNAYAIVNNLDGEGTPDMVSKIDRLVSVYAIDRMDAQTREEVVQLWQTDPNGVTSIVAYIQSLNEAEEAKPGITEQARLNGYKGYIPNEGRKNTQIVVDLDSNKDARERMGYVKLDIPYQGETDSIYPRSYYVSTVRRQGAYSQGVIQNVAMTYRGVDTNTGMTVGNSVAGLITGDSSVDRIVQDQLNPNTVLENEQEALMPVFAGDGSVLGFERSISNEIQELHLGREENLAVMLGAWAGRQVEESLADQYNKQLVDELHKIWENRENGSDAEFEDMKRSTDKIYQESWKLIPQSTKSYIESKFDGAFMVPRSMVNLAVGYREPSITDMWSGKSRMPKPMRAVVVGATEAFMGRKAMRMLAAGEEALQGTVSTAKDIIVVRSLVVPVANIQANAMQLANAGVPLKQITKGYRSKLAEAEEFIHNRTKIIDLQQKRIIARNDNQRQIIDDRIQVLEDLNKQMSIAPMIAAGQFKQLSEGITDLDVDISSGRIGDYIEKLSEKLPERAADIAKVGLVSKSTKLYQVLNRATQYGDFIAKSIYYDHLISQGLSAEVASAMVNEEFVNFSVLPGRVRSGLESNGLTWFMAFKIRILKIAAKQMRDNPVRSLALNAMTDMNSPISDNILAVMAAGNLDYATGYEMLFDAPELNPWINLMNGGQ
ncbi:N4 v-RNAP-like protein [Sulfitobacter phage EE36phi1]|uniref:N4 v-RNAP-like protein n=1 Tax=Sulfitobacter phage EE36phi1 TaxID=490913 RepID=C4NTE0_9CAUD|nr:virion RNA polymerase [Sulfitobacter phage EE36phi1]ACL81406.1 N4 v-RNAP-like protein [Sulfitobacter phage EE36phi1]